MIQVKLCKKWFGIRGSRMLWNIIRSLMTYLKMELPIRKIVNTCMLHNRNIFFISELKYLTFWLNMFCVYLLLISFVCSALCYTHVWVCIHFELVMIPMPYSMHYELITFFEFNSFQRSVIVLSITGVFFRFATSGMTLWSLLLLNNHLSKTTLPQKFAWLSHVYMLVDLKNLSWKWELMITRLLIPFHNHLVIFSWDKNC